MKPLRTRLQEMRSRLGIPWEVLERDFLLSWVLAGIARVAPLRDTLVFKGGTALKKCYFGDSRFSEDVLHMCKFRPRLGSSVIVRSGPSLGRLRHRCVIRLLDFERDARWAALRIL